MEAVDARALWHAIEPVNAVIAFAPECWEDLPARLGLEGVWMGYFAARAAPMGRVEPGVVTAAFFNFHPDQVARALPDAWMYADPAELVEARSAAAAAALRRLLPSGEADRLAADVLTDLRQAAVAGNIAGRPLYAANVEVTPSDDPVSALWQAATTLREHRGDGHVALLTAAGLDGCEALVLFAASSGLDAGLFQRSRGWSPEAWQAAVGRLADRGLLEAGGALTTSGRALRDQIEGRTDELAAAPYVTLGDAGVERLRRRLDVAARAIAASGEISYPNPMGLPPPARA